jgi:hypothetical protein
MTDLAEQMDPELAKILESDIRAGFKIEITFGPDRSALKEYYALISLWESGKFFHGGGDANMYWCLDCRVLQPGTATKLITAILDGKEPKDRFGCAHPIPNSSMGGGLALCPRCQKPINSDNLTGQVPFFGTTQDLAKFCARYFQVFADKGGDIYCKYHPTDIRYKAMEQAKGLEIARRLRGMFIYPYKNILKDTLVGASLENRFLAFFNS